MWACWLLEYLLQDVADLVPPEAIHDRAVFGALLRYLRTPGTPFKSRVVALMTRLLKRPHNFRRSLPDFRTMDGVEAAVMTTCTRERSSGNVFLPSMLQQLVELCMSAVVAKRTIESRTPPRVPVNFDADFVKRGGMLMFSGKSKLRVPVLHAPFSGFEPHVPVQEAFIDVMDMAECLVMNARMPDRIVCAVGCVALGKPFTEYMSVPVREGLLYRRANDCW